MRLILVHGINQEGKSESAIKEEWLSALGRGLGGANGTAALDVRAPFYGDRLAQLTSGSVIRATAQGVADTSDMNEIIFTAAALSEQAQAAGVSSKAIAAEERANVGGAVEQGFPMNRRVNAIVRVLERISPLHGDFVMRLLQQAYAYLKRPGISDSIDAIVRPILDTGGPAVVVAHSLGTVVTFKLLRQLGLENRPIEVPLLVTVGSPLTLMAVQAALGPAFIIPNGIRRWLNAVDPADFIALGRGLDATTFTDGIENIPDVHNIPDNPHAIIGYLGDSRVASAIANACALEITR